MLEAVGNGDRPVFLTHLLDPFRPDRVGEMGPVVVSLFELLPAGLEILLPLGKPKQLRERRSRDQHAVVEVGFPRKLDDPLDFVLEILELVEEVAEIRRPVGILPGELPQLTFHVLDLWIEEVGEALVERLVVEAVVVDPERVTSRLRGEGPVDRGLATAF